MSDHNRHSGDAFGREDIVYENDRGAFDEERETEELHTPHYGDGGLTEPRPSDVGSSSDEWDRGHEAPLFDHDGAVQFRERWAEIQTGFVDEPRRAVEEADQLVEEVTERLTEKFAASRSELERQWSEGDEASTEDLRQALKQYRAFFDRLLSV